MIKDKEIAIRPADQKDAKILWELIYRKEAQNGKDGMLPISLIRLYLLRIL